MRVGQLAVAQSPNTRVNIQGGPDPEVITRASTLGLGGEAVQATLTNIENAINNLTIETVIAGGDLKVLLHRQNN